MLGLGYVGLPVALGFSRSFPGTVGYDVDEAKVRELAAGHDRNREVSVEELRSSSLVVTSDPAALVGATFFVVAVPTPVDENRVPDLRPVKSAAAAVGRAIAKSSVEAPVVVFESTVYPGLTREVCGPILAETSGRTQGQGFKLGYSPERINPGDKEHTLEKIVKVVAGEDPETLERVASAYGAIVKAGVHRAASLEVAEAAKVIENTQRDINIALMNELALIFDRMGIRTKDVLDAAGTKWNFLPFRPGLVGGHCIGVDPYYLTTKAQQLGYQPEVILAGRRINDNVSLFVAQKLVKMLAQGGRPVKGARVGVLGLTFKEDCSDLRNSKVPGILRELESFGVQVLVHDPIADGHEARAEYGVELCSLHQLSDLDGLVLAVCHREYLAEGPGPLEAMLAPGGVFVDVKSAFGPERFSAGRPYWSL